MQHIKYAKVYTSDDVVCYLTCNLKVLNTQCNAAIEDQ